MSGITLYDLTRAGQSILTIIEQSDNPEEWRASLESIQVEITEKIINCGMVYRNLNAEADIYEQEEKRLAKKKETLRLQAEYLRNYMEINMRSARIEEIKAAFFKVKFRKLPDMVEIEGIVDQQYCRHIPEKWEPDKMLIKELIGKGEIVGARLLTDRTKLEIK
jgi:hypothetical protein